MENRSPVKLVAGILLEGGVRSHFSSWIADHVKQRYFITTLKCPVNKTLEWGNVAMTILLIRKTRMVDQTAASCLRKTSHVSGFSHSTLDNAIK